MSEHIQVWVVVKHDNNIKESGIVGIYKNPKDAYLLESKHGLYWTETWIIGDGAGKKLWDDRFEGGRNK